MNDTTTAVNFEDTSIAFSSKSDAELYKMYLLFATMNSNRLVKAGGNMLQRAFKIGLPVNFLIKPTLFNQFCGGETIEKCTDVIEELGRFGIGTILDYSVEGEKNEPSFDHTAAEIIATIEKAATSQHVPFSVFKVTGIGDGALLEKVQHGIPLLPPEQAAYDRLRDRVQTICQRAYDRQVRVFVDAEESWLQDTIDHLTYSMMRQYNQEQAIVYNTYQLYRHDSLKVLKRDHEQAVEGGYFLGAKLVRGAYMEKERKVAQRNGYNSPINPDKASTDDLFDQSLRFCVQNLDRISFCSGTHNEASSHLLIELMEEFGIARHDQRVYSAQLYGMSDNLSYNLAHAGYNVAKYVPYGPVEAVMPYLMRRADENTAIAGQSSREFNLIKKELARRKKTKQK
jgi:proline dehydrogenase